MIATGISKRALTVAILFGSTALLGSAALAQSEATVQAQGSVSINDTTPEPAQTESDQDAASTEPGIRVDEDASAATANGDTAAEGSCQAKIDALAEAGNAASTKLDEIRKDMEQAAISQPLLLAMADGSFVYLGDQGEMTEPLGSWFTAQDMVQQNARKREEATALLEAQNEAECLALIEQAGQ